MSDSVFTRIIRREIPAVIVYEDAQVIAFMDAGQVNPGRVLLATQRQIETLMGLEGAKAAHLFVIATRVAKAAQTAFEPAGWQTVPHVHIHVLPRYAGDGADLIWPRKEPGLEALREYAARIRL